jgi:hypothetical protein
MSVESFSLSHQNGQESATPIFDKVHKHTATRGLIERSVGYDGALMQQVLGPEGFADHKAALIMKAAGYIGKDAIMQADFGEYQADSAEKKLDIIVDELVEAQMGPEVLNDANAILREKVAALSTEVETLKDRISPDVQYLYGKIERLQAEVDSANDDLERKSEALDREIMRTAERDRQIEEMRKESKPAETTGVIETSVIAEVPALDESHTLKAEIAEIRDGFRKLGGKVAHVVGVRL